MEYEKCYVLEPEQGRPTKRRRMEVDGLQASWNVRHQAYRKAWGLQRKQIEETLSVINAVTLVDITSFLDEAVSNSDPEGIPTGIISAGPDTSLQSTLVDRLFRSRNVKYRRVFVSLSASSGTSLKAILKAIIRKATFRNEGFDDDEDEDDLIAPQKGVKLLNYDLQILADFVREREIQQIVLSIGDTEAFDHGLLSELIEILGCWRDRIPFVFLLSIATSVDFLQQRLSKGAVKCLKGRLFDVALSADVIEQVFEAATSGKPTLWIGPSLMPMMIERQSDYIQSIDSFVDAFQYAYMSCYYANALSLFLDSSIRLEQIPKDHLEAARNVDSFRPFCRKLLENGEIQRLQDYLDNDTLFFGLLITEVDAGRRKLQSMMLGLDVVRELQRYVKATQPTPKSTLYGLAMTNQLNGSSLVRELLISMRKASSDKLTDIMNAILTLSLPSYIYKRCTALKRELDEIIRNQDDSNHLLRSEDDVKNSTLRTTVVAQKVELSKQKSTLSKQDSAYTTIVRTFTDLLERLFVESFVDPKSLPFHEIFLYDLKSPHREVFTPRPRHAIERALATPHDYLDCDCCAPGKGDGDEAALSECQPATAVLYQLYLESGTLINVSDLWQAFQAVMGDEQTEKHNMALFQRGLADLRYLGMVKGTRKRADHIAKVAWRGL